MKKSRLLLCCQWASSLNTSNEQLASSDQKRTKTCPTNAHYGVDVVTSLTGIKSRHSLKSPATPSGVFTTAESTTAGGGDELWRGHCKHGKESNEERLQEKSCGWTARYLTMALSLTCVVTQWIHLYRVTERVDSYWHISTIRLYSAIHVGSWWKIQDRRQIKNTDNTQTKHNPEKANNANLPWFSCLIWHSATKRGGLILQRSQAHMGWTSLQDKYPPTMVSVTGWIRQRIQLQLSSIMWRWAGLRAHIQICTMLEYSWVKHQHINYNAAMKADSTVTTDWW